MKETVLVGVYDSLRKVGKYHNAYMRNAEYLGVYYTEPEFTLYSLAREFPGLRRGGSTSVLLEIYRITREELKNMDFLQCSGNDDSVNLYNRVEIDTPFGECYIYEYTKIIMNKPRIESGDWFQYRKQINDIIISAKSKIIH